MRSSSPALHLLLLTGVVGCVDPIQSTQTTGSVPGNLVVVNTLLDFGVAESLFEIRQGQVSVQNTGDAEVVISSLAVSVTDFSVTGTTLTLLPASASQINVYFNATQYGPVEGVLTLGSDDVDTPIIDIQLRGEVLADRDGDGHERLEAGGTDCDDEDPESYPGAPESWYDGVDSDCAGDSDYDQDRDGYESDLFNPTSGTGGGDCNDVVAEIYPGAEDVFYDGVDSNCDKASDWDWDGDGYASALLDKGGDCDDFDPLAYPGAAERLNGKKDDCDAEVRNYEIRSVAADVSVFGTDAYNGVAYDISLGDLDGDGQSDIVTGQPWYDGSGSGLTATGYGSVAMWLSSDALPVAGDTIDQAYAQFDGSASTEQLGAAIGVLDNFLGDGEAHLVVGAPGHTSADGKVFVISASSLLAFGDTADAHTTIVADSTGGLLGLGVSEDHDLDADGVPDLVMAFKSSTSTSGNNRIMVVYGGTALGDIVGTAADAYWTSDSTESGWWVGMSSAGDINGDGYHDLLGGNPNLSVDGTEGGGVYVKLGKASQLSAAGTNISSDWTLLALGDANDGAGYVVSALPDQDGDGDDEWAYFGDNSGYVWTQYGAPNVTASTKGASTAKLELEFSSAEKVSQIRALGDWTADGVEEWGVAIDGSTSFQEGELTMLDGALSFGSYDAQNENLAFIEASDEDDNVYFAWRLPKAPGDVNGDGWLDLVTGDPAYNPDLDGDKSNETHVGALYLFYGSEL